MTYYTNKSWLLLIIIVIYSTIFAHSQIINVDIMEARNFITAREIIKNHNWLIPTMNGEVRIAKPPLPTWFTAIAMMIAGTDSNIAMNRLPAGIIAFLLLCAFCSFVKIYSGSLNTALFSTMIMSTNYLFILMARRSTWDIFAYAFMMGAIWCLLLAWKKQYYLKYYVFSGVLMGMSWMSKGPVAFYAFLLPFILSYWFIYGKRDLSDKWTGHILLSLIALIISVAWPLYIYINVPNEVLSVLSQESGAWASRHVRPFWYYIRFPAMSGVWCIIVLPLLWPPFGQKRINKSEYQFLILWIFLTVLFLSFVPEKKERYLFPILIPMSILIGLYIDYIIKKVSKGSGNLSDQMLIYAHYIFFCIILLALPIILYYFGMEYKQSILTMILLIYLISLSFIFISFRLLKLKKIDHFLYVNIFSVCLIIFIVAPFFRTIIPQKEFFQLFNARSIESINNLPIYTFNKISLREIWAFGRKVRNWDDGTEDFLKKGIPIILLSNVPKEAFFIKLPSNVKIREINAFALQSQYHLFKITL